MSLKLEVGDEFHYDNSGDIYIPEFDEDDDGPLEYSIIKIVEINKEESTIRYVERYKTKNKEEATTEPFLDSLSWWSTEATNNSWVYVPNKPLEWE